MGVKEAYKNILYIKSIIQWNYREDQMKFILKE